MPRQPFTLLPALRLDALSPQDLEHLARVLKKYEVEAVKFVAGGQLRLAGLAKERLPDLAGELQALATTRTSGWYTSLQVCPGSESCRHGIRDGQALAQKIDTLELPSPPPGKIKIGIAGCSRCCTEPYVRDIGIVADRRGWKLLFGGNAGSRPRIADLIAEGLRDDEVIELLGRCLTVYLHKARPKMRTARFLETYGIENFRRDVLKMREIPIVQS